MGDHDLIEIIEGALLAAGEPMTKKQLAQLFDELDRPSAADITTALATVAERCEGRGFELAEVASGFRFQVRQHLSPWVSKLWVER
ncbi:MAG: SMC-Scp complex subunit ScpB, partial [Gammaproteobacteria bacterium]|nr:SMC-Scp complex subunit ScpB [Gammaproteobacteria bacterium]